MHVEVSQRQRQESPVPLVFNTCSLRANADAFRRLSHRQDDPYFPERHRVVNDHRLFGWNPHAIAIAGQVGPIVAGTPGGTGRPCKHGAPGKYDGREGAGPEKAGRIPGGMATSVAGPDSASVSESLR